MAEQQKRKTMESPSTDEREVSAEHIAQIERLKHITNEEYHSLVTERVALPIRLQVQDASEGDLENHPCGIDLYTGLRRSGWLQGLHSFLKKSTTLGIEQCGNTIPLSIDASQENLADVVRALYTGDLEVNNQNIESKLFIVDYLQIQVLVDPMMKYISHHLAEKSPEHVCGLHERFHLLRNLKGYSILECICQRLSKSLRPAYVEDLQEYVAIWPWISNFIEKGDETFAKSIFEIMAPNVQSSLQVMALFLPFLFRDKKVIKDCEWYIDFYRDLPVTKDEAEFMLSTLATWKEKELDISQAAILLDLYDFLSRTALIRSDNDPMGLLLLPQSHFRHHSDVSSLAMHCPIGILGGRDFIEGVCGSLDMDIDFICDPVLGTWTMSVELGTLRSPHPLRGAKVLLFYFVKKIAPEDNLQNKGFGLDPHVVKVEDDEWHEDVITPRNEYVMRSHPHYFHAFGGTDNMLAFATLLCETY